VESIPEIVIGDDGPPSEDDPTVDKEYVSHKLLRLVSPFLSIVLLFNNLMLLDYPIIFLLFLLQTVFYLVALLGLMFQRKGWGMGRKVQE